MQISLGSVTTQPGIATSQYNFEDRIFALTPSASSPDVIANKDNVFQMCFSDPNQGLASAQYIYEQNLGENVYIIWKNDDVYSTGIKDQFVAEAEELGLNIVGDSTFTEDTKSDFTVQLTDAQQKGADLVFLPMYYEPASLILTQADAMGYEPKFFGVDGMDGILTMDGFDASLAEGVMLLTPFNADATDEATVAFVEKYESLYGETPNQFAADGYDCIYALKLALETAGCTPDMSNEEICDALIATFPTITFNGLTGDGGETDALVDDLAGNVALTEAGNVHLLGDFLTGRIQIRVELFRFNSDGELHLGGLEVTNADLHANDSSKVVISYSSAVRQPLHDNATYGRCNEFHLPVPCALLDQERLDVHFHRVFHPAQVA